MKAIPFELVFLFSFLILQAQPGKHPVALPGGVREYPKWLNEYHPDIDLNDPELPANPTVYAPEGLAFRSRESSS